jgi:hypothetical protein
LGRGQQSLSPGRGQAERESGRRGGDHGEARRHAQASCGFEWPFKEHAELPTNLDDATARTSKAARKPAGRKPKTTYSRPADKAAEQKAAVAYEREQKRRDRERAREEAAGRKSANAGSRPSTRRNRRWTRLNGSMRRDPEPSRPRRTLSRRERKPKMPAGKGEGAVGCGAAARGARVPTC